MKLPLGDIEVQLEIGRVMLRPLTFADLRWIESALKESPDAHAFARRCMSHQLRRENESAEDQRELTDDEVAASITTWAADPNGLSRALDRENPFESFRVAADETVAKHNRSAGQITAQMMGLSNVMKDAMNSAATMIKNPLGASPAMYQMDAALSGITNAHVAGMFATSQISKSLTAADVGIASSLKMINATPFVRQSLAAGIIGPSTNALDDAYKGALSAGAFQNILSGSQGLNVAAESALTFASRLTGSGIISSQATRDMMSPMANAMRTATAASLSSIRPPELPGMRAASDLLANTKLAYDRQAETILQRELSTIIRMNQASGNLLESIRSSSLDRVFDSSAARISSGLFTMSTAATEVWREWADDEDRMKAAGVALRRAPHFELYTAARVARIAVAREEEAEESAVELAGFDLIDESVERMLLELGDAFLVPYRGAAEALYNRGTDHVRHFATSFRDLLTHVIHHFSPDAAVREWTSDPNDFNNGRPKRQTRLRYIYQHVSVDRYAAFVSEDIERTLDMFEFFHQGTHQLSSVIPEGQLRLMWLRANGLLSVLLEAARQGRH